MTTDRILAHPDDLPNIGFNLEPYAVLLENRGIIFEHWVAIPSPIGQKNAGEYRRSDAIDTISSNGFVYKKVGEFNGVILSNSKKRKEAEVGEYDDSIARLVFPKHYNGLEKEIQLLQGDRIYAKNIELKVPDYQRMQYNPVGMDEARFPIQEVTWLLDSQNVEYVCGKDFKLNKGYIEWIPGSRNPGLDPDTHNGRIYSLRYTYLAFWYITDLINEIRVTNDGTPDNPVRMPYHAMVAREYIYRNKNNAGDTQNPVKADDRIPQKPLEKLEPNDFDIKLSITDFE